MKKEYKCILIGMFIFFFIFSLINIFLINKRVNRTIYIKELDSYTKNVTKVKEEIDKVEDEECKESFTNMLNRINDTYFSSNITLKEYYKAYFKEDDNFLSYYSKVIDSCDIDADDSIYIDALASMEYPNEIKKEYNLRYEFKLNDFYSEDSSNKEVDETGTYLTKTLELRVIKLLLDEAINE